MNPKSRGILFFFVASSAIFNCSAWAATPANHLRQGSHPHTKYLALRLGSGLALDTKENTLNRYGVPFVERVLPLATGGSAQITVGGRADRIFLLGMTDANTASLEADSPPSGSQPKQIPAYGWADPRDYSYRFFVGDELGRIRVNYIDGSTQVFPLLLGEGIWWGRAFYDFQDPFSTDAKLRKALASSLRLYPPLPLADGNYVAVIVPRAAPIQSITVESSPAKKGTLVIKGITVESRDGDGIAAAAAFAPGALSPEFENFVRTKALRPIGKDQALAERRLNHLKQALYTSDREFKGHVAASAPPGYSGPEVSFRGNIFAEILANAFRYNVQDIVDKIDTDGMYHTSTRNAISWAGYRGFGTFRRNVGGYYGVSYTRDMGRSLQEITALGYTDAAMRCADYSLRMARRYATDPALKFKGVFLPPHWGDLVNRHAIPASRTTGRG